MLIAQIVTRGNEVVPSMEFANIYGINYIGTFSIEKGV